jgi:tRNA threonylcarbamoyl adenosine modification protein YjeE
LATWFFRTGVVKLGATQSQKYMSSSETQTLELGAAIGLALAIGDCITLIGPMGAGKTQIAKGIVSAASQVNYDDVVSPSFSLVNRYEGRICIDHADLYRLSPEQTRDLDIYDVLEEGALVIEWGQHKNEFEENELQIAISYTENENCRLFELSYSLNGLWDERLETTLNALETQYSDMTSPGTLCTGCHTSPA